MADQKAADTVAQIQNNVSEAATVEEATVALDEDIHAIIPESEIGAFYGAVRQTDADADMFRDGEQIRGFLNL